MPGSIAEASGRNVFRRQQDAEELSPQRLDASDLGQLRKGQLTKDMAKPEEKRMEELAKKLRQESRPLERRCTYRAL